MEEVDFVRDFKSGVRDYFTHKTEYSQVQAVLIAWSENDVGPEQELKDLRAVFEKDYQFSVSTFNIPNHGSSPGAKLNLEIASLVDTKCNHSDSLVIIYYAGHCGPDKHGNAEWAAFETGGPTLSWHITQQIPFAAHGDVLVLLDCCNASLLTRRTKDGGRFELLAASAKGAKTPIPGRKFFTRALIKELKKHAAVGIDADELADRLREDDRITDGRFVRRPAGYVLFRASLSDDVTGREIADWLKTAAPKNVTAVDIELVITRARRLQGLLDGQGYADSSVFSRLSEPARQEIVRQLQGLNTVMSTAEGNARDPTRAADRASIEESIESINSGVANVCSAVETPILLDLSQDSESLEDDELVTAADAGPAILLRRAVESHQQQLQQGPPPVESRRSTRRLIKNILASAPNLNNKADRPNPSAPDLTIASAKFKHNFISDSITFIKTASKFKTGTIEQKIVVIETYKYQKNDDGEPYQEQAKKMVSLLRHPKLFETHHDVYSLVVVLLEMALWKDIGSIVHPKGVPMITNANVHKSIVCLRSGFLRRELSSPSKTGDVKSVKILNHTEEEMALLLEFIYSGGIAAIDDLKPDDCGSGTACQLVIAYFVWVARGWLVRDPMIERLNARFPLFGNHVLTTLAHGPQSPYVQGDAQLMSAANNPGSAFGTNYSRAQVEAPGQATKLFPPKPL
ncbi:hypothetical protein INS49_005338 [Diaporthe citri]|uniref:uncharacterized protein n=1 Tax=Diaporthe citri TaxID=83186 RepID=UPI001C810F9E|nr:uncharacterized protein INS49_005338 [Diaporthe citri]KAG6353630.1 hypothetical protein INS49_005338 [Diaporthe citri]